MATQRMLGCVLLAGFAIALLGCSAPRHPRISLTHSGYGDEGAESLFIIDSDGRFRLESKGDAGNGVIVTERCTGALEPGDVAPLFAEFANARLTSGELDHEADPRERSVLTLESEPGQPRSPADVETFERLIPHVWNVRSRAKAAGRCTESRSRR